MRKQYRIAMKAAVVAMSLLVAGRATAGSLDPTNAPGPTMHTLEEIYQKVDALGSPQTLSSTTAVVNAGYYAATTLTAVDTDLTAGNIKSNVTIFGVMGTLSTNAGGNTYSASVPQTGQTPTVPLVSPPAGSDGNLQKGVVLPTPRFTVQADTNCVLDNLTGLVWARNANLGGTKTWSAAITYCEALDYGGQTDWRLPNAKELYSLIDLGRCLPALPSGHPFAGVQSGNYWSSSTDANDTGNAWRVGLHYGYVNDADPKSYPYNVWPVRAGQ